MTELKQKALEKMLVEMNDKHTSAEDQIHNWLCEQDDDELFKGILKEGKTIADSLQYCASQARKQAVKSCAMVDDKTVFGWVKRYFTDKKTEVSNAKETQPVKVVTSKINQKKKTKKTPVSNSKHKIEQLYLFEL